RAARLDPVRRPAVLRRGTLLRLAAVAVLLVTAAGLVYTDDDSPSADRPVAPPASASATPEVVDRLPVPTDLVGVAVPLWETTALAVLRPGDRVDLFSVPPTEVSRCHTPTTRGSSPWRTRPQRCSWRSPRRRPAPPWRRRPPPGSRCSYGREASRSAVPVGWALLAPPVVVEAFPLSPPDVGVVAG